MPEPMRARAVDSHTHLNHPRLLRHVRDVLSRARRAGVEEMVVVGYDLSSSERAVALAEANPSLWAAVGLHPHDASALDEGTVDRLRELARSPRVVAVGETGLDFHRDLSPRDRQMRSFERHLELAGELGLPAVVHCREAQEVVLAVMEEQARPGLEVIWHCFEGSPEQAQRALALGAALGFTGVVTYEGSDRLREVAAGVPEERLLLETDCPYLAPEPRRGKDNEPANLSLIAERLAEARGIGVADLVGAATATARRVFRLGERQGDG